MLLFANCFSRKSHLTSSWSQRNVWPRLKSATDYYSHCISRLKNFTWFEGNKVHTVSSCQHLSSTLPILSRPHSWFRTSLAAFSLRLSRHPSAVHGVNLARFSTRFSAGRQSANLSLSTSQRLHHIVVGWPWALPPVSLGSGNILGDRNIFNIHNSASGHTYSYMKLILRLFETETVLPQVSLNIADVDKLARPARPDLALLKLNQLQSRGWNSSVPAFVRVVVIQVRRNLRLSPPHWAFALYSYLAPTQRTRRMSVDRSRVTGNLATSFHDASLLTAGRLQRGT